MGLGLRFEGLQGFFLTENTAKLRASGVWVDIVRGVHKGGNYTGSPMGSVKGVSVRIP